MSMTTIHITLLTSYAASHTFCYTFVDVHCVNSVIMCCNIICPIFYWYESCCHLVILEIDQYLKLCNLSKYLLNFIRNV